MQTTKQLATRFRHAMDCTDFVDLAFLFDFPNNSGEITSTMLGVFLFENGIRGYWMVSASRPDKQEGAHWWLEKDGTVVDITADQFVDYSHPSVIIADVSEFHDEMNGRRTQEIDDRFCDRIRNDPSTEYIRHVYDKLIDKIASSQTDKAPA